MKQQEHVRRTAIKLIKKNGLINLSRESLCIESGIPDGSFPHVMGCTFSELVKELGELEKYATTVRTPVTKSRANPVLRKEQILAVAVDVARKVGCHRVTRDEVAHRAGVSMGLVSKYFGTMNQLRRAIMRAAIQQEIPSIILMGLANNDPQAEKAPAELKALAARPLV